MNDKAIKASLSQALSEYVEERGNEYVVLSKKGKVLGTHPTRKKALAQLRAIEASKNEAVDLSDMIEEALFEAVSEMLSEDLEDDSDEPDTEDYTDTILNKFPTLKRSIVHLLTADYRQFVDKIGWVAPKPSTFMIFLKNGQTFTMKWLGKGFQATIGGKNYDLINLPQYQQALDKLGIVLATAGNAATGMEGTAEAGDSGGFTPSTTDTGGGDDVGFGDDDFTDDEVNSAAADFADEE